MSRRKPMRRGEEGYDGQECVAIYWHRKNINNGWEEEEYREEHWIPIDALREWSLRKAFLKKLQKSGEEKGWHYIGKAYFSKRFAKASREDYEERERNR